MALFRSRSTPADPVDPALERLLCGYEEEHRDKAVNKLATLQDAIKKALRSNESLLVIAINLDGIGTALVVVTNQRSIDFDRKGRVLKELAHHEVAETLLAYRRPTDNWVANIESHSSRRDYRPDDPQRFSGIIVCEVSTREVANLICATVDEHL
jgi:hypothetical protein